MRCKNPSCNGNKFRPSQFLQQFCRQSIDCKTSEAIHNLAKIKDVQKKDWNKRKEAMKPITHPKEFKITLQNEINKMSRMIDAKLGFTMCIDCGINFGKQIDGGHFKSIGSNATLRYNLHNIHSQASNCNRNGMGGGKQLGYYKGLIERYGQEYANYVDTGIQTEFTYIGLKDVEYPAKIALVRKLIRDFDTFKFSDGIQARELMNKMIGIYK